MSTVSDQPTRRAPLPTNRGRRTQAAIDAAARTVIARKGILATTIADIAAEAGRSTASFYNYYDSKEAMVREWALRFRDEANQPALTVTRHGLTLHALMVVKFVQPKTHGRQFATKTGKPSNLQN